MKKILFLLLFTCKMFSQVLVNPTSTIECGWLWSYTIFTVTPVSPPYTCTVQTPCQGSFVTTQTMSTPVFTFGCAGVHTITLKNSSNAIIGTFMHSVSIRTNDRLDIFSLSDSLCPGEVMSLSLQMNPLYIGPPYNVFFHNFLWNTGDTSSIIFISPPLLPSYSVSATLSTSLSTCYLVGAKTIFVNKCQNYDVTGIPSYSNLSGLKLYPNPVSTKINLEFDVYPKNTNLILRNSLGQNVFNIINVEQKQEIDLTVLPAGIYYLKVENSDGQKIFKVIKE